MTTEPENDGGLAQLKEILAKHGEGPKPVEADADPGDEAEAVETEQPEAGELAAEGEAQAEEGSEDPDPEVAQEPDPLEDAYAALQRDGWRLSGLKGLPKAELIRMGKAAAKRQAEIDGKFSTYSAEIGDLKQKLESAGKSEAEPGRESPGHPASATLSEIAKRFAEVAGIEQRDAEPILAELGNSFSAPLRAALDEATSHIGALQGILEETVVRAVRRELSEKYPELNTKEGQAAFRKKLERLNPKAYADLPYMERAMVMSEEAAENAFGKQPAPASKPKVAPKRNQPSLPGAKTKPHRSNPEAEALEVWHALERKHGVA